MNKARSAGVNILVACIPTKNPFVRHLKSALLAQSEVRSVRHSTGLFWAGASQKSSPEARSSERVDVVHVQWPEGLFEDWGEPGKEDLARLKQVLERWKQQAPIVVTVHNEYPHYQDTSMYRRLYRLVYSHADGFVHLGNRSRAYLLQAYDFAEDAEHTIIPHGNFSHLENDIDQHEARRHLGLADRDFVVLAFGQLRHPEEVALLLKGFRPFTHPRKRLLVAGRLRWIAERSRFYSGMVRRYYRARTLFRPRISFRFGFFPDEEVQCFLNAADVVVIPRKHLLNSGNVALGFTFGRVVVGPDRGVVGEVLRQTGNPVFDPEQPRSLARSLERAAGLAREGKGEENQRYTEEHMDWQKLAGQHVRFFKQVLRRQ